LQVFVDF